VGRCDLDFWLGEWDATWAGGGRGRNSVTKVLDGKVVLERFDGYPGTTLQGMSMSVYDEGADHWVQTWMDNEGGWFHLAGRRENGEVQLLCRQPEAMLRMRFYDIAEDAFSWSWERSADGGATWQAVWRIAYARRA
jgi:hypothetical protein